MTIQVKSNPTAVITWLWLCTFMVFAMMVIGAITRLTESGLSMVEWRPLIGALPPMSEQEWQRVFEEYQQSPEYQKKNFWMELNDFKTIFFWEWFHRLWGRLIGLVFALPLLLFWLRGMIPAGYHLKFLGMLILGGLQGLMGWYMVQSGLVDNPAVSHYRLAAHLSLAMVIMALLIGLALSLMRVQSRPHKALFIHGVLTLCVLTITILWGAFTAGLDAGLLYNETFPKMGGQWIPPEFNANQSLSHNFLENHAVVQFTHRWLAIITVFSALSLSAHGYLKHIRFAALHGVAIMACVQLSLGIATLLTNVHLHVAVMHQAGAAILLGVVSVCLYQLKPRRDLDSEAKQAQ